MTFVTLVRLTSIWLCSHTTSWDILLCGNCWLWDLCVLAQVDMNSYIKRLLQKQYCGRISPRPAQIFHTWYVYSMQPPLPFEPMVFFQHTPPPQFPRPWSPLSPHGTADSHASTPQAIHQLYNSVSTPSQNTPLQESLRQNSRRDFLIFTLLHSKPPAARNLWWCIKFIYIWYICDPFSKPVVPLTLFPCRGVWWGVPWYSEGAGEERGGSGYQDAEARLHRETKAGLSERGLHHGPVLPPEHNSPGGSGHQM